MDSEPNFEGELPLDAFPRECPQVKPEHRSKYALIYPRVSSPEFRRGAIRKVMEAIDRGLVGAFFEYEASRISRDPKDPPTETGPVSAPVRPHGPARPREQRRGRKASLAVRSRASRP